MLSFRRKRTPCVLFLFLLFFSCNSCPQWYFEKAKTCDRCFDSARLYFEDQDLFCQVELELIQSASGLRMYLDTFSRPLCGPKGQESNYSVSITVEENSQCFKAELLEGGQRLLLPDEARDFIIDALLNERIAEIVAGPYRATILPTKFRKHFKTFQMI